MTSGELINHIIPFLKEEDSLQKAMLWMEELRITQIPVAFKGKFTGILTEDIIYDFPIDERVEKVRLTGKDCVVSEYTHFWDLLKVAYNLDAEIIAVIDEDEQYLGAVFLKDVWNIISQATAIQSPGGVIILSLKNIDYSLSEISRLIESNNAKILSSFVLDDKSDNEKMNLVLKINQSDLNTVVATLQRFHFNVISRFDKPESITNEKERIDLLMKFINI